MNSTFRWTRRPLRPYCIDVPDDLRDNLITESLSGYDGDDAGAVTAGSSSSLTCDDLTCLSAAGRPERAQQWHLQLSEKDAASLIKYKVGEVYGDHITITHFRMYVCMYACMFACYLSYRRHHTH